MKKTIIKLSVVLLMVTSISTVSVKAEEVSIKTENLQRGMTLYPDGYEWNYGFSYTLTGKHVQYSNYTHGTKDHSATAMVDGIYNKGTAGPGKTAAGKVTGSRNPSSYNSYYNFW